MTRTSWKLLSVATVAAFGLGACGEDSETNNTYYVTSDAGEADAADARIIEIPAAQCSAETPYGVCEAGQRCFEGTCVAEDTLCGPTNTEGVCPSGTTCFAGGCILSDALCSDSAPTGVCPVGETCLEGDCIATNSLCSATNVEGACAGGLTCIGGLCGEPTEPEVAPCDRIVYTEQPDLAVHSGDAPPPTVVNGAAVDPRDDSTALPDFEWQAKTIIEVNGLRFKDLNGNGTLEPYEDWRRLEICRAQDLVGRMNLDEKIGVMNESSHFGGNGTTDDLDGDGLTDQYIPVNRLSAMIKDHKRYALFRAGSTAADGLARYINNLQEMAEGLPLGIPVVITVDPIHHLRLNTTATGDQSLSSTFPVSEWPTPLGLGAVGDPSLTYEFGDTVRREFMAMGIRWELGPMADSATEPRWERVQNTYGENPVATTMHVHEVVRGFQGSDNGNLRNGVAVTIKHFPGAGANEDGMDSHSFAGRNSVYPGDNFDMHLLPFQAAFDVGVASVMPCYSVFVGQTEWMPEQTPAGYDPKLIQELLKEKMGFTGMITADWGTNGHDYGNNANLSQAVRAAHWLKAGSHQFGSDNPEYFRQALLAGYVDQSHIDGAVAKILEMSFKLGLFENPYVDATAAGTIVRSEDTMLKGFNAQRRAIVMLRNRAHEFPAAATGMGAPADAAPKFLPLSGAKFVDANANGTRDAGEYTDDTNNNGQIEVYFDGVRDSLVMDPARPDPYEPFLGAYDYTTAASTDAQGAILPVVGSDLDSADIAILRIGSRRGTYFGLDAGVPLGFDEPFPGLATDTNAATALLDRNRVLNAFRARDGYVDAEGNVVEPTNPTLRIVLVMYMDRPGIATAFVNGMTTLDEIAGVPGSYPLVSDEANIDQAGLSGVDAFFVDFGAHDRAVLDVVFNVNKPADATWSYTQSRLPMELPRTDEAVEAQFEDLPSDSFNPLYFLGAGQSY